MTTYNSSKNETVVMLVTDIVYTQLMFLGKGRGGGEAGGGRREGGGGRAEAGGGRWPLPLLLPGISHFATVNEYYVICIRHYNL